MRNFFPSSHLASHGRHHLHSKNASDLGSASCGMGGPFSGRPGEPVDPVTLFDDCKFSRENPDAIQTETIFSLNGWKFNYSGPEISRRPLICANAYTFLFIFLFLILWCAVKKCMPRLCPRSIIASILDWMRGLFLTVGTSTRVHVNKNSFFIHSLLSMYENIS